MQRTTRVKARRWVGLGGWLLLSFSAAAIGSLFTPGAWYDGLTKPSWTPPSWVFAPVWSILYAMMGVAAWRVWEQRGMGRVRPALVLFVVQLALNAAWSWLFFGVRSPALAGIEILFLWAALGATVLAFWRVDRLAGALLLPYLLWVGFAAVLNFRLWRLNP